MKKPMEFAIAFAVLVVLVAGVTLIVSNWYDNNRLGPLMKQLGETEKMVKIKDKELVNYRAAKEEEVAQLQGHLDSVYFVVGQLNEDIQDLTNMTHAQAAETAALLTGEVQDLIDASPPLRAYIFSLRNELATKDRLIFTLSQREAEKDKVISLQEKRIQAEIEIGLTWKRQFENSQSLLSATQKAFSAYRHSQTKKQVLWTSIGAGLGFLGGVIAD